MLLREVYIVFNNTKPTMSSKDSKIEDSDPLVAPVQGQNFQIPRSRVEGFLKRKRECPRTPPRQIRRGPPSSPPPIMEGYATTLRRQRRRLDLLGNYNQVPSSPSLRRSNAFTD